ncbi:MAG: trans-aconitate 2-methyltransferase [Bauldia sp.]
MTSWSPAQYLKFEDERSRPARDLLAAVPLIAARRVIDFGCGPGNSTELLAARFPEAEVTGLDSSPEMLAEARVRLPRARFVEADLAAWLPPEPVDLLFANAVFQWVPRHLDVLERLLASLPSGGVLAVQMPDNLAEPSHEAMREVAASGPWSGKLASAVGRRDSLPPPAVYYDRLKPTSTHVEIWHTVYNHALAGPDAIVEWVKGTGLRPFLAPLDAAETSDFLAQYRARLAAAYPPRVDGSVLFRFPRIFIVAMKG